MFAKKEGPVLRSTGALRTPWQASRIVASGYPPASRRAESQLLTNRLYWKHADV